MKLVLFAVKGKNDSNSMVTTGGLEKVKVMAIFIHFFPNLLGTERGLLFLTDLLSLVYFFPFTLIHRAIDRLVFGSGLPDRVGFYHHNCHPFIHSFHSFHQRFLFTPCILSCFLSS